MEDTLEIVLSTVVPALAALLAWCVKLLTTFIQAKTNEIKNKTDNETVKSYVDLISDNATNVVISLNQTLVEELKAASSDGKLTKEDAVMIKDKAVAMLADTLSEDIKETIAKVFKDTNTYLGNVIERVVVDVKDGKKKKIS